MKQNRKIGFSPIYDENSKVLILGSFPSVKSREIDFYYGNKQNRFWKMLCGFFQEEIPATVEEKKAFLIRHNIALWDMIISCEIQGSADASIKNAEVADIPSLLQKTKIEKILLNGTLAYELFEEYFPNIDVPHKRMPSTSPANPRYEEKAWEEALNTVF